MPAHRLIDKPNGFTFLLKKANPNGFTFSSEKANPNWFTFAKAKAKPVGFTLIELLIVTFVIMLLATIGALNFNQITKNQEVSTGAGNLRNALLSVTANSGGSVVALNNFRCTPNPIDGWGININSSARTFAPVLKCKAAGLFSLGDTMTLPTGVTYGASNFPAATYVVFQPLSKGVYACSDIALVTDVSSDPNCTKITTTYFIDVTNGGSTYRLTINNAAVITLAKTQ